MQGNAPTSVPQPSMSHEQENAMTVKTGGGHNLSPNDPDSPQNFSLPKKIYVSSAATAFAFVV